MNICIYEYLYIDIYRNVSRIVSCEKDSSLRYRDTPKSEGVSSLRYRVTPKSEGDNSLRLGEQSSL